MNVAFKRVVDVCKKQYLWVGLTCTILEISFQRAIVVCVMLVALASHHILMGLPIQSESNQSTEGDGKGRDRTK